MQITNRQQPFQKTHAKKRPLANPFGNLNVQSSPPQNDFERLDNNDQNAYGNMTYSPDRTTTTSSFSQDYATNYSNGGEYEQQNSVSFNDSYQQNMNTRSVNMRGQSNYSTGPTEDFEGFAPGVQALQAPVVKANSMLGTVFGFASMFMGGNGSQGSNGRQAMNEYDEENEPPLLEDLGIDLKLIKMRALSVLKFQKCSEEFVKEADMSGPLLLFLTLGSLLLLSGKVHFGYIYGFGVIGTVAVYMMMNLISQVYKVQLYNTMSILGYCLFPVVVLAFFNIFFNLVNFIGLVLSAGAVIWATLAATNFFQVLLNVDQQKWLIAYPILLFYKVFVIITIF